MSAACTIVAVFCGVDLGPCGDPAEYTSVGRCERGHDKTHALCAFHARALTDNPADIICGVCAADGVEMPMPVTITDGVAA